MKKKYKIKKIKQRRHTPPPPQVHQDKRAKKIERFEGNPDKVWWSDYEIPDA